MKAKYLLHFVHEHVSFRWTEFLAVTSKNNCKFKLVSREDHIDTRPFIIIELTDESPQDNLIRSAQCSYLLKDLYELWAQAKSVDELNRESVKSFHFQSGTYSQPDQSFRVNCESFRRKLSQSTKIEWIKKMTFMDSFQSNPNLSNPKQIYTIFEMYDKQDENLTEYYFARHLTKGSRTTIRNFSLKTRKFIANTSMDPELSFITANAAKIKKNDLVYDPFVGSGSLLVAAAHMGAYVMGSDIDWLLLHGKSRPSRKGQKKRNLGECVKANLEQYNLADQYIDVLVSDVTRSPTRLGFNFDAILADPPYGVRESSEKIGIKRSNTVVKDCKVRFPSKVMYNIEELLVDLLLLSVKHLSIGGRLVYYLPVTKLLGSYDNCIPNHPCLQLISYCEQPLAAKVSRLMVVMEKRRDETEGDKVEVPKIISEMKFRDTYFSKSLTEENK